MIRIALKELLADRSIYWLSRETGIRWSTLAAMAAGKTHRLEIRNLGPICEALECEPGDLLIRVERKKVSKHK